MASTGVEAKRGRARGPRYRGLVVALLVSLGLHGLAAAALRALGLGGASLTPPLLVDLVDPVVARSSPDASGVRVPAAPAPPPHLAPPSPAPPRSLPLTREAVSPLAAPPGSPVTATPPAPHLVPPAAPRTSPAPQTTPLAAVREQPPPPLEALRSPPSPAPIAAGVADRPPGAVISLMPSTPGSDLRGHAPRPADLVPPGVGAGAASGAPGAAGAYDVGADGSRPRAGAPVGASPAATTAAATGGPGPEGGGGPSPAASGHGGSGSRGGSTAGALAPGKGTANDGAGVPAEYDGYVRALRQRIQERLAYPEAAVRRRLQGTVEVELVVDQTGRLASARLVGADESTLLDEAALRAVREATPFPFPPDVVPRALRIRLPVVFVLR